MSGGAQRTLNELWSARKDTPPNEDEPTSKRPAPAVRVSVRHCGTGMVVSREMPLTATLRVALAVSLPSVTTIADPELEITADDDPGRVFTPADLPKTLAELGLVPVARIALRHNHAPPPQTQPTQQQQPQQQVVWPRVDAWDETHVRLPCSPRNGTADGQRKWVKIVGILSSLAALPSAAGELSPADGAKALCEAILGMNPSYRGYWDMTGLQRFFSQQRCSRDYAARFFGATLPRMAAMALRLPVLCGDAPLPLLCKGQSGSVTLTQLQVASLLCNAFFCTFPRRNEPTVRPFGIFHQLALFSHLFVLRPCTE